MTAIDTRSSSLPHQESMAASSSQDPSASGGFFNSLQDKISRNISEIENLKRSISDLRELIKDNVNYISGLSTEIAADRLQLLDNTKNGIKYKTEKLKEELKELELSLKTKKQITKELSLLRKNLRESYRWYTGIGDPEKLNFEHSEQSLCNFKFAIQKLDSTIESNLLVPLFTEKDRRMLSNLSQKWAFNAYLLEQTIEPLKEAQESYNQANEIWKTVKDLRIFNNASRERLASLLPAIGRIRTAVGLLDRFTKKHPLTYYDETHSSYGNRLSNRISNFAKRLLDFSNTISNFHDTNTLQNQPPLSTPTTPAASSSSHAAAVSETCVFASGQPVESSPPLNTQPPESSPAAASPLATEPSPAAASPAPSPQPVEPSPALASPRAESQPALSTQPAQNSAATPPNAHIKGSLWDQFLDWLLNLFLCLCVPKKES